MGVDGNPTEVAVVSEAVVADVDGAVVAVVAVVADGKTFDGSAAGVWSGGESVITAPVPADDAAAVEGDTSGTASS